MKLVALLPMKGHSERVPNKNMRRFGGSPLYHAILQTLLASPYIRYVIIDTDSSAIARDAQKHFSHNVRIIQRPPEIQGDFVSMNEIIAYDLSTFDDEHVIQTHSTNPLLTIKTLNCAIETYLKNINHYDSLFSVTKLQTRLYDKHANPVNHNPNELLRTQDLEPLYEENSNFYIFSQTAFKNAGNRRIGLKPQLFEVNKLEAIDIDEPEDFQLAELLYTSKERQ